MCEIWATKLKSCLLIGFKNSNFKFLCEFTDVGSSHVMWSIILFPYPFILHEMEMLRQTVKLDTFSRSTYITHHT